LPPSGTRLRWLVTSGKDGEMAKKGRKRRTRRKNKANHGKRPNAGRK
jgi:hypothetical protein